MVRWLEIGATIGALTCALVMTGSPALAQDGGTPKVLSGTQIVLTTVSGWSNLFSDSATVAQASAVIGTSCSAYNNAAGFLVDAVGRVVFFPNLNQDPVFDESDPRAQLVGTPAGQNCQITLRAPVSPADSANGTFVLSVGGTTPDFTAPYIVQRSSLASVYLGALAIAAGAALVVGAVAYAAARRRPGNLPEDFKYTDGWSSGFGVLGTGLAALLTATGVLPQFIPQFQVGGLIAANLIAAFFILLAPAAFVALKSNGLPDKGGLYAAAILTMVGVFYQILLVGVLLGNAGLEKQGGWILVVIAVTVVFISLNAILTIRNSVHG